MRIESLGSMSDEILDELLAVWEKSVHSSHHFLNENDIEILLTRIRNTSAFPTERHYISTAVNAKIPIACGAALPYIKNFLKHLVNEY